MATRLLLALVLLVCGGLSPGEAAAGHKCQCLYQGRKFEQGELVCIKVDGATRFARCDMLLNNSSWTFLKTPLPHRRVLTRAGAEAPRFSDARLSPSRGCALSRDPTRIEFPPWRSGASFSRLS